jgi:hypothetical protein
MNRVREIVPSLSEINQRLCENAQERAVLQKLQTIAFKLSVQGQAVEVEQRRQSVATKHTRGGTS